MNRPTFKEDGKWILKQDDNITRAREREELAQQAIERLAKYEDMEEQGLLVRLPCKVGDSFFVHRKVCDEHGELEESVEHWGSDCYGCNLPCNGKLKVVERKFNSIRHIIENMKGIGDSIFLSREEAEKALEVNNGQK